MNQKKILFVLPFKPYPLTTGGAQAIFNGIDVVKDELDVYVTFEAVAADKEAVSRLKSLLSEKVKVLPYFVPKSISKKVTLRQRFYRPLFKTEKRLRKMAGYDFTPIRIPHRSWLIEELFPKKLAFAKYVMNLVGEYDIGIVQCEMLCNITFGLVLPERVRKVFVHHELGWVVHELELQGLKGDDFEQRMWLEYYKTCEVALLNTYDDIITLSTIDTQKLLDAGVKSTIHTSMAVVNTLANRRVTTEDGNVLSFIGPESNLPNIVGIKWFLDKVWGKLRQVDPSYKLQIIGKWNLEHVSEMISEHENVRYLGFVDDLPSVLKDTVMIVPITIGSGIRMKILEAASMGVPFVTTSVGTEGIPVEDGIHCLIADTPESFLNAILKMKDAGLRMKVAENANRLVAEHFTLDVLRRSRLEIYRQM